MSSRVFLNVKKHQYNDFTLNISISLYKIKLVALENVRYFAHSVKAAIKSVQDKINSSREKLEEAHRELDEKVWSVTQSLRRDT